MVDTTSQLDIQMFQNIPFASAGKSGNYAYTPTCAINRIYAMKATVRMENSVIMNTTFAQ